MEGSKNHHLKCIKVELKAVLCNIPITIYNLQKKLQLKDDFLISQIEQFKFEIFFFVCFETRVMWAF